MGTYTPVYDKDGGILYFEAEYPKTTLEAGSKSPYFRGEFYEDSKPAKTMEVPPATVTRPEW